MTTNAIDDEPIYTQTRVPPTESNDDDDVRADDGAVVDEAPIRTQTRV